MPRMATTEVPSANAPGHPLRIGRGRVIDAFLRPAVRTPDEADDADLVQGQALAVQAERIDAVHGFATVRDGTELRSGRQERAGDLRRLRLVVGTDVQQGVLAGPDVVRIHGGGVFLQELVEGLQGRFRQGPVIQPGFRLLLGGERGGRQQQGQRGHQDLSHRCCSK